MISEALGQAYLIPQRRQAPAAAPQPAPAEQPSPWQGQIAQPDQLAQVEGLTNNYYNAYSRLKDFTETMWKDYGLDVTKPDFTQTGGGNLHQAFQAMDADLRLAANDLAQHKKNIETMNKLQAEGKIIYQPGYDPTKMLSTQMQPYQMYTPTDIAEDVQLAVQGVSNKVYNTATEAQNADRTLDPLRKKYSDLIKSDPNNAAYYQRQINALRTPTVETRTFREPGGAGSAAQQSKAVLEDLKYHINLFKGNVDPSKITEYKVINGVNYGMVKPTTSLDLGKTTMDIDGKKYEVTKTIDHIAIGSNGQTYAYFTNDKIPPLRLDTMTPDEVIRAVYENNPTYGKNYVQTVYNAAQEALSPSGSILPEALSTPEEAKASRMLGQVGREKIKQTQQVTDQLIGELKSKVGTTEDVKFQGITISPNKTWFLGGPSGTFSITREDYKKLIGAEEAKKGIKGAPYEDLTIDQIIELLQNSGKIDKELSTRLTTSTPSTTTQTPLTPTQLKFKPQ